MKKKICGNKIAAVAGMPFFTCGIGIYLCDECAQKEADENNKIKERAGSDLIECKEGS